MWHYSVFKRGMLVFLYIGPTLTCFGVEMIQMTKSFGIRGCKRNVILWGNCQHLSACFCHWQAVWVSDNIMETISMERNLLIQIKEMFFNQVSNNLKVSVWHIRCELLCLMSHLDCQNQMAFPLCNLSLQLCLVFPLLSSCNNSPLMRLQSATFVFGNTNSFLI